MHSFFSFALTGIMVPMVKRKQVSDYIRSAFFGIEDSLVSTTGFIAGVSIGTHDQRLILFTGILAISVEAISMSAGEFLSEETSNDLSRRRTGKPLVGGVVMLFSYLIAGSIPLLPAVLLPQPYALPAAITAALAGLFTLGYFKGKITKRAAFASGIKVLTVGGIATAIGILVAKLITVT